MKDPYVLPTGNIEGYSVQLRNFISGKQFPHSFLAITGPDGITHTYGLAPASEGSPVGTGRIFNNDDHLYDPTRSGINIELTGGQYQYLSQFINQSIQNPPYYSIPLGQECTAWAMQGLTQSGVISEAVSPNSYTQTLPKGLLQLLIYNPVSAEIGISEVQLAAYVSRQFDLLSQYGQQAVSTIFADHSGQNLYLPDGGYVSIGSNNSGATTTGSLIYYSKDGNSLSELDYGKSSDQSETEIVTNLLSDASRVYNSQPSSGSVQTVAGSSVTTKPSWYETVTTDYSGPNGTGTVIDTTTTDITSMRYDYSGTTINGYVIYDTQNGSVNIKLQGGGISFSNQASGSLILDGNGNVQKWSLAAYNYDDSPSRPEDVASIDNYGLQTGSSNPPQEYLTIWTQNAQGTYQEGGSINNNAEANWVKDSSTAVTRSITQVSQSNASINVVANDTLTTSGSNDTFVFSANPGSSIVTNFATTGSGHDVLSLPSSEFSSLAQVLAGVTTNSNGDAVLNFTPSDSLTLSNVSLATLKAHPEDFIFHA